MSTKAWITLGLFVGGTLGGLLPSLFGASSFGLWAVLTSATGGIAGIFAGYHISQSF